MSHRVYRLQPPTKLVSDQKMRLNLAIDVLGFTRFTVQARRLVPATGGASPVPSLYLQHAAVLDEDAFVNVDSNYWDLRTAGNLTKTYTNLLRYVRWYGVRGGGAADPVFMIDLLARS